MTQITHDTVYDFLLEIKGRGNSINASIYGYVIRLEERLGGGSHLGKSIRVHPGNDSLECCKADILAMAKDYGVKIVEK